MRISGVLFLLWASRFSSVFWKIPGPDSIASPGVQALGLTRYKVYGANPPPHTSRVQLDMKTLRLSTSKFIGRCKTSTAEGTPTDPPCAHEIRVLGPLVAGTCAERITGTIHKS